MKFNPKTTATFFLLITIAFLSCSARLDPTESKDGLGHHHKSHGGGSAGGIPGMPPGGFFGPGGGFGMPGVGAGWPGSGGYGGGGYGAGYGGPTGGYSRGGVVRPTVVCKEKGPCYMQKLRCPAKCFTSFHRSGRGYGAGGGGGGCTIDCKKKCTAYC